MARRARLGIPVRPWLTGWHVECAAIAAEYLGPSFDVQAGGSDLVFPHHEMSGSHARVACGAGPGEPAFARVYAHSGMVSYQGAKMSKSLGNLVFVSRLRAAGTDPMAIRLALLAHHYRSDWEWTDEALAQAQARLERWRAAVAPAGRHAYAANGAGRPRDRPRAAGGRPGRPGRAGRHRRLARRGAGRRGAGPGPGTPAGRGGRRLPGDAALIRGTADALLGVALQP